MQIYIDFKRDYVNCFNIDMKLMATKKTLKNVVISLLYFNVNGTLTEKSIHILSNTKLA